LAKFILKNNLSSTIIPFDKLKLIYFTIGKFRMFPTAKAVYNHVCKYHLLNSNIDNNGMLCMWSYCDQIKRQKWSLVNHIQVKSLFFGKNLFIKLIV
jgi:hypothetical protein